MKVLRDSVRPELPGGSAERDEHRGGHAVVVEARHVGRHAGRGVVAVVAEADLAAGPGDEVFDEREPETGPGSRSGFGGAGEATGGLGEQLG
jgi:hypothetical protein